MFVSDFMTAQPETVQENASLLDAQTIMKRKHIRHLPVLDASGRLTGIITDRDVRLAVGFDKSLTERLLVADVMTGDPVTVPLDATLDTAVTILCERRIGAMPVMRFNELAGIITRGDLLRAFHRLLGLDRPGMALAVAIPDRANDMARAFHALGILKILGALMIPGGPSRQEPVLYLRLPVEEGQVASERLSHSGLLVLGAN